MRSALVTRSVDVGRAYGGAEPLMRMTSDPVAVVAEARRWIGTPYRHQASLRGIGTDCLGLVRGVYAAACGDASIRPPAYGRHAVVGDEEDLWNGSRRHLWEVTGDPRPGHVLLFRMRRSLPARHVAVMSGDEMMIHALSGHAVCEERFSERWRSRHVATFAFPETSHG